jgi:hypothetical protein
MGGDDAGAMLADSRPRQRALGCLLFIMLLGCARSAHTQQAPALRIATWNLAWLMGRQTFEQWTQFCGTHDWNPPSDVQSLRPLPYCDVHSGMVFPLKPCLRQRDPGHVDDPAARFGADHPCRDSLQLHTWAAYSQKLRALGDTAAQLKRQGIEIVFMQEVYDRAAAREVFPEAEGWRVETSAEQADPVPIPQQVGVAYRGTARMVGSPKLIRSLALTSAEGRAVRPGLEVSFRFAEQQIDFLVLHLKAGCRSQDIDDPKIRRDSDETSEEFEQRQRQKQNDCRALRAQIPALEQWIDAKAAANRLYAIVGDTNRTLLAEGFDARKARLAGSDSLDPKDPITENTKIARLTPEVSDKAPPDAQLNIVRADYSGVSREPCGTSVRGIDHFALGSRLSNWLGLAMGAGRSQVLGYGEAAYGSTKALPSDHCPHYVVLQRAP